MRWQKTTPTEAQFQKAVIELAELHGWRVFHAPDGEHMKRLNPTGVGFPDLVLAHGERHLLMFIELKTETGKTTREQEEWLDTIEDAGIDCEVWRPSMWRTVIEPLLTGANVKWT